MKKFLALLLIACVAASGAAAQTRAPAPPSAVPPGTTPTPAPASPLDGTWRGTSDGGSCNAPLDYLLSSEPLMAHMELATRPLPDFPLELLENSYAKDWKRRTTYPVLFYQYDGHVIWGLTARVLFGFLNICRSLK